MISDWGNLETIATIAVVGNLLVFDKSFPAVMVAENELRKGNFAVGYHHHGEAFTCPGLLGKFYLFNISENHVVIPYLVE
jgi:hypothetical protein